MQSLVVTVPGLKWDEDDNGDAMVGRALTYLVLYSTLGMIVSSLHKDKPTITHTETISDFQVRWSYGVRLLSQADPEGTDAPSEETAVAVEDAQPEDSDSATEAELECPTITVNGVNHTDPKFFYSFPNSPSRLSTNLPQASSSSVLLTNDLTEDEDEETLEIRRRRRDPTTPTSSPFQARLRRLRHRIKKAWKGFNEFMTVPLWAALASIVVACVRPIQHILESHVEWVKGALDQAGSVSIPLTLVVLGAYFYTPVSEEEKLERSRKALPQHADEETGRGRSISTTVSQMSLVDNVREMFKLAPRRKSSAERRRQQAESRPGETKTVVVAILSRMVITPLLLLPLMAIGAKWDFQEVFAEYVSVLVLVELNVD